MLNFRVGLGFDTHAFQKGEFLTIGGVEIPFHYSFKAHSDGDVLVHAIIDSLLGAAGLKDIGSFFPDNDPKYKDIDSLKLLEITMEKLKEANWKIGNIDCNIIIQKPKMAAHIPQMKLNVAKVLNIETSQIGIKAKTSENIGFIGREEGASAQAVCLIYKA